jgi:uncharacterized membrane protein
MAKLSNNSPLAFGAALAGFLCGFIMFVFLFAGYFSHGASGDFNFEFNAATTITIVLAALAVMLTALGIIIAVVGAIGFSILRTEASKAAEKHASEQLGEDGDLRKIIEQRVNEIVAGTQTARSSKKDFPNPDSEYGE